MNVIEEKAAEIKAVIESAEVDALERMTQFRVSDAIREGSSVSNQAYGWTEADGSMCALSAAAASAKARGYLA